MKVIKKSFIKGLNFLNQNSPLQIIQRYFKNFYEKNVRIKFYNFIHEKFYSLATDIFFLNFVFSLGP